MDEEAALAVSEQRSDISQIGRDRTNAGRHVVDDFQRTEVERRLRREVRSDADIPGHHDLPRFPLRSRPEHPELVRRHLDAFKNAGERAVTDDFEAQIRYHRRDCADRIDEDLHSMPWLQAAGEPNGEVLRSPAPVRGKRFRSDCVPHHLDLGWIGPVTKQNVRERRRHRKDAVGRRVDARLGLDGDVGVGQRSKPTCLVPQRSVDLEDVRETEGLGHVCTCRAVKRVALVDRVDLEPLGET